MIDTLNNIPTLLILQYLGFGSIIAFGIKSVINWYFKKKKTPVESLEDEIRLKLKVFEGVIDSLQTEVDRCKVEIKELKEERSEYKLIINKAFDCKNYLDCPVIKTVTKKI